MALKMYYILDPNLQALPEASNKDTPEQVAARTKRAEDELFCRGHILNALSDRLYDLYQQTSSTKEIWTALNSNTKLKKKAPTNSSSLGILTSTW